MSIQERLNRVFQTVFHDNNLQIRPEMTADDIEEWDSLSYVDLIMAVESTFNIKFGQREILAFKNIGDLMSLIEKKLAHQK